MDVLDQAGITPEECVGIINEIYQQNPQNVRLPGMVPCAVSEPVFQYLSACASHLFAEGAIEAIAKVTTRYSESVKDSGFKELYYEPDSSKNFLENLCLSAMSASSLATTGFMIFKDNIFSANSTVAAGWWTGVILGSTYLSWKKSIRKDKARKKLSELAA